MNELSFLNDEMKECHFCTYIGTVWLSTGTLYTVWLDAVPEPVQ